MHNLRLRIKASDYELEAEGSRDFVREQYEAFRRLLGDGSGKSVLPESRDSFESSRAPESPTSPLSGEKTGGQRNARTESFQQLLVWDDRTQRVKSTVLPDGPMRMADTVLLLLLGYRELRGSGEVPALALNKALSAAGFNQFRMDRIMAPYLEARLVLRSGVGKGSRYRLTTRGVKKARELVQALAILIPDPLP